MAVTDNFNRADGAMGGNWAVVSGTWGVASNQCKFTNAAAGACQGVYWSANSFNNDQTSRAISRTANLYYGIAVRVSGVSQGTLNGYVYFNNGSCQKVVNGSNTTLGSGFSGISNGDTAEIDAVGTTITPLLNGSSPGGGPFTDSAIASGAPGMVPFDNGADLICDDWQGTGEIVAATGSIVVHRTPSLVPVLLMFSLIVAACLSKFRS